jgi:DNA topoisomerase-6 subunit B
MPDSNDESIAEELASQQREISVAEFFEQNRQMLGFGSKARAMVTAVKEGVDNSIDAAEEAEILPDVSVTITETDDGYYSLTITDNGPGITEEQIPKVFGKLLYGSRFAKRVQSRGQQGIGISAAVLYGQLTTGKPAEVTSKTAENDEGEYFKVGIDTDENEPVIQNAESREWPYEHESGTSITIFLEASFRARSSLHKYIEHTAIVNPHATIALDEPNRTVEYERTVNKLPEKPEEIKPHPHGIEFGTLRSLIEVTKSNTISGFLQREFTRVGQTTADEIVQAFMDRVDGRYCVWQVPDADARIPVTHIMSNDITWEPDEDEEVETTTLQAYITDHINRKPADVTEAFASGVVEALEEQGEVPWTAVHAAVADVADSVESTYDTTLGGTVREKVVTATWDVITTARRSSLIELVGNATSERKTDDDIAVFATILAEHIADAETETDSFTKAETHDLVERTVSDSAEEIDNAFGSTAEENVFTALWDSMRPTPNETPLLREVDASRDLADALHSAMGSVSVMAPPSHCLSPIGEEELVQGMKKVYDAEFYSAAKREASAHSGEPFLVEAGIAHGGDIEDNGAIELLRFANRVPLVYKQGACCITSVVSGIRWNNYKLSDKGNGLPQGPVAIVVHVASTNVPFTSESKDAVASVEIIEDEIERVVRDVARDLKRHLKKQRTLRKRQEKQDTIAQLLPEFSKKVSSIASKPEVSVTRSLAQIMNNLLVAVNTPTQSGSSDENTCSVTAANFDNQSTYTPSIAIQTDEDPGDIDTDATVNEVDGEWVIEWDPTIEAGAVLTLDLSVEADAVTDITVEGYPAEKVTTVLSPTAHA